ncbi:uncharacterized protein LOC120987216 [Bufo bufo]|uniref:uncharacterized protein LOC120987216 n=1 Tax=Bufo bufo TaxID=8384 RepID=UPI001ABDB0ED|nr:uncharacterized protein LOC120987216 [Bufo bufo]
MTSFDVGKLIVLIEERPNLWDTRCDAYHDRIRRDRSWGEIGKELAGSEWDKVDSKRRQNKISKIKTRWNTCRDQFRRELNMKKKRGDGSLSKKPYLYTNQLQFLRPIMEIRPTVDNLEEEPAESRSSFERCGEAVEHGSDPEVQASQTAVDPELSQPPDISQQDQPARPGTTEQAGADSQRHSSGRRQRAPHHDYALDTRAIIDLRALEYLNQNRGESKEEGLLRGLAPYMRRVPDERQTCCIAALAMLLDLFAGPSEPMNVVHHIEKARDDLVTGVLHLSQPTNSSSSSKDFW